MAESTTGYVVDKPESTSGSPLVDAALNNTADHSAVRGTKPTSITDHVSAKIDSSKITHDSASAAEINPNAVTSAAEPSAGDAVLMTVLDSGHAQALGKSDFMPGELTNGIRDDMSQGEGLADDKSTADISVDVSINSDTDNSRVDTLEKKDSSHHNRTNSVKKPTAFSKVTATKNFMNKVAPSAPIAPKLGEKLIPVSAIVQPNNRPRLVAKTGPSLANLQKSRLSSDTAGSPDASKVWNKNRPVAPPPPRHFTDEELKQQYGIHLATRLQTDESGKESKWADIDDDEDDWAPETVVWMDGTKSTVTPQDSAPPSQEQPKDQRIEQKPALAQLIRPAESVRPMLALKRTDVKILKPGSAIAQIKQDGPTPSPGLEKQALKAKSPVPAPAPAPVKSPWAAVPKVESVSPVNPPVQQPLPPLRQMPSQDARAYESPVPPPAREIAADTFDRGWREGEGGARELFNSTNGRYEPAPDGRRSSIKPDHAFRKPALLQRPTPAEPSAAFQSRTSSQMDGSWGRRRGSSVSQGSLPPCRRMSSNQRPELTQTPEMPQDAPSPMSARGEPAKPSFTQQSAWNQQMPPRPQAEAIPAPDAQTAPAASSDAPPTEDPVKVQDRVMKEKRELAIKRRQEEAEREQAARQERLKAKLAALEGAGKSKKEREAEAAAAAVAAKAASDLQEPPATLPAQADKQAEPSTATRTAVAPLSSQSLAPTAPTAQTTQSPQLEGLPSQIASKAVAAGLPERPASNDQTQKQIPRTHLSPRAAARVPYQPSSATYKVPASSYSSPGDRKPQPFVRSPNLTNDTFSPWPTTAPNSNVWGSSGIGNGTFESASSFAPMQQNSSLPPPPGMTRPATSARISPQGFSGETRSPSLQQQQMTEQQRAYPPPGMDSRPDPFANQARLNGISPAIGAGRPIHPPGPIGPPSRAQQPPASRSESISAWNAMAHNLPNQFAHEAAAAAEQRKEANVPSQVSENRFKETFKKTSADQGKLGTQRKYEATEYIIHDAQGSRSVSSHSPAPPTTQTQPTAPLPGVSPLPNTWNRSGENAVRIPDPSRNPAHGGVVAQQPPIGPPNVQHNAYHGHTKFMTAPVAPLVESKDQSPPPPETQGHPVNDGGNSMHPHVKLPPPQVKVKLPPTSPNVTLNVPMQNHGPVLMPQRPYSHWGPPSASKPIVQNEDWQARFNGLFNRTQVHTEIPPSPPKTPPKSQGPVLAIASSSRIAMDELAADATVFLPQPTKPLTRGGFSTDDSTDCISKPGIEEVFMEELSFGSTPKTCLPKSAIYNTSPYPPGAKNMIELLSSKSQLHVRPINMTTGEEPFFYKHPSGYFVTIPKTRFHNKLFKKQGAHERQRPTFTNDHRSGNQSQDRQDHRQNRKAPQLTKDKGDKEERINPDWRTAGNEGFKKTNYKKPSRQISTTPTNGATAPPANTNEVSKVESMAGETKKSGWGDRGGRGSRQNNAATPAVTPIKSG